MKIRPNRLSGIFFSVATTTLFLAFPASGQEKPDRKKTISVTVEENRGGKTKVTEKKYRIEAVSGKEERTVIVNRILDSLESAGPDTGRRITITVAEGDAGRGRPGWNRGFYFGSPSDPGRLRPDLRRMEANAKIQLRHFKRDADFNRHLRGADREALRWSLPGFGAASLFADGPASRAGAIRGLQVYPNQPENHVLNIRFTAPGKGTVLITVADTRGREVGRKEVKDFSGDFFGQIELKKKTTGTLFVTAVQNEDGAVRRIVLSDQQP